MKTDNQSISDVLTLNNSSFYIPPFQRAYAWGKPEIERYFNDILRIIESAKDPTQKDKLEHFFGTLVIKKETGNMANMSVVVDGQQRLTTTLLFLIALRDLKTTNETQKNDITESFLKNNKSTFEDKIKLKQVTKDWEAYRALVNGKQPQSGIIYNAYSLFGKLINENPQIEFDDYILALQKINVAIIFLDERPFKGEDPQIIFETLNSLGKPLTLSDLVRNYVLLKKYSEEQSKIYEDTWHPKIEAVLNENTSHFFRDYLQYKTTSSIKVVSDNNTKEVYQLFKEFVEGKNNEGEKNFNTHNDFINDIVRYVNWYKWIITAEYMDTLSLDTNKNKEIKELIRNIFHDIKSEAFKPFVLGLLECHQHGINSVKLDDELFISILKTIRTYLIRRRIIRLSQGENKNIVLLCGCIEKLAIGQTNMVNLLSNMFYSMRFPNDDEMRKELISLNFYEELKKYSKFILGKIEENNTKVSVDFRNPKITIEHIMPQTLNSNWKEELGFDFTNIHKTYLHNIGNLILTEFNSEMGYKAFTEKKEKLKESSLNYRLSIINKSNWNKDSIIEHQGKMIDWFLETFPLPDTHKTNSNWNTNENESTIFTPLDNNADNIAEGNKPAKLRIYGNDIKVKDWQDVFIKFMEYIKNNDNFDFDFMLDNQDVIFNRKDTIIKWANFKLLVEEKNDLTSRYKTFKGETWNKVNNLNDKELFIHINFSAPTCMTRIANIMNKFNMPENSVEIVLKSELKQNEFFR